MTLAANVRISAELYENLREIRLSLESQHSSAAPTVQDLVSTAIERLLVDWEDPEKQSQLLEDLLEHRRAARARMGRRNNHNSQKEIK